MTLAKEGPDTKEYENINKEFRMVILTSEHMEQLKAKQQDQVNQVKAKLNKVEQLKKQIRACSFQETGNNFISSFFGELNIFYPKLAHMFYEFFSLNIKFSKKNSEFF